MSLPIPDDEATLQRSIGERDRFIVLGGALLALIPIAFVVSPLVSTVFSRLVVIFVVAMLFAAGLAFALRHRFINKIRTAELHAVPTGRSLSSHAKGHADSLVANGFALTEIVVLSDGAGEVFTRPLALLTRTTDGQVALCGELGIQLISKIAPGALVVTASHDVVAHDSVLVSLEPQAQAPDLIARHDEIIAQLRSEFGVATSHVDPREAFIEIEKREQATLNAAAGLGTLNRALIASGEKLNEERVRGWLEDRSILLT